MDAIGGEWHAAMVRGEPLESGWGASHGYPRLRLDTRGEPVRGQIFAAANLAAHWDAMDTFEGEQYTRVLTDAELEDGTHVSTYVYVSRHV